MLPQGDVQAVSLDGSTTVFFIDDGTELPPGHPLAEPGSGSTPQEAAIPHSNGKLGSDVAPRPHDGNVEVNGGRPDLRDTTAPEQHSSSAGAGVLGAAGAAGAAGVGAAALASSRDRPQSATKAQESHQQTTGATPGRDSGAPSSGSGVPSVNVQEAPESSSRDEYVHANTPSGRSVPVGAAAGAALLGGAAASGAMAETSDTRLGDERAASSASITAIHGGSEGRPVHHHEHEHNAQQSAGQQSKPDSLHLGDLPPPRPITDDEYPLGSPDQQFGSSAALGVPSETKRGFDPAASTASITAIRSGTEGNSPSPSTSTSGYSASPLSQAVTADTASDTTIPASTDTPSRAEQTPPTNASTGELESSKPSHTGAIGAGVGAAGVGAAAVAARAAGHADSANHSRRNSNEGETVTPGSGFYTAEAGNTPAGVPDSSDEFPMAAKSAETRTDSSATANSSAKRDPTEKKDPSAVAQPTGADDMQRDPVPGGNAGKITPVQPSTPVEEQSQSAEAGNSSAGVPDTSSELPIAAKSAETGTDSSATADSSARRDPTEKKDPSAVAQPTGADDMQRDPVPGGNAGKITPVQPSTPVDEQTQSADTTAATESTEATKSAESTRPAERATDQPSAVSASPSEPAMKKVAAEKNPVAVEGSPSSNGAGAAVISSAPPTTAKGHSRTASSSSSARRRKVGLLSKLKGEMKVLSGKISHDDKKVAEGERLRSGE